MSVRKRPRQDDRAAQGTHDIRCLLQRARESAALRTSGPFFLERAILSRLLPTSPASRAVAPVDATRLGLSHTPQHAATLLWPARTVATAQRWHFKSLRRESLRTIVPPNPNPTPVVSAVKDIVFDMEEQFAVVCQPRRLTTYATEDWLMDETISSEAEPIVSIAAIPPNGSRPSASFAFSSAQFFAASLHLLTGYHSAPVVDVFDLEEVDETTSAPQQRLTLPDSANGERSYASDVVCVTPQLALAALSSGLTVWLDRRSGKVTPCTGLFARAYSIGQQHPTHSGGSHGSPAGSRSGATHGGNGTGPLSAVAFLCREDPVNVLCGTVSGAVQLWDVRFAKEFVSIHQTAASICRLHPSYHPNTRGTVWLNNYAGEVQGLCIGANEMCPFATVQCHDAVRSSATFHLPLPRLAVAEAMGLLACPHVSSNSLLLFDTSGLLRQGREAVSSLQQLRCTEEEKRRRPHSRSDPKNDNQTSDAEESIEEFDDDDDVSLLNGNERSRGFVTALSARNAAAVVAKTGKQRVLPGNLARHIPYNNVINYEGYPNISACAVWSKYERIIVGDAEGRIEMA